MEKYRLYPYWQEAPALAGGRDATLPSKEIETLRQEAITDLARKLAEAKAVVADLEKQYEKITRKAVTFTASPRADEVVPRIHADLEFVSNVVPFMADGGFLPSTSQKLAHGIMGTNFFGITEAARHFGVNPSVQQLAALAEVPFSEEVLRSCKDTHVLVAVFPLLILGIREIDRKQSNQTLFYAQDWYIKEPFAKDKGEIGWQLVRKEPVTGSTSKNWCEQQALLSKDEGTPKAQVVVYTTIGHFLATGERLFEKLYVRCSDLVSDGHRVHVGFFGADGLDIDHWDANLRFDLFGLVAYRKTR